MKTATMIMLLAFLQCVKAQHLKTIYTNENQAVALFFPDEIRQGVVGSEAFTFTYNKETPQHFGLLQGVKGKNSNLLVITKSGEVYAYFLDYRAHLDTLNHFITTKERIGLDKPAVVVDSNKAVTLTYQPPKIDSLKILNNNRTEYFKKLSEFQLRYNRNKLKKKRKGGLVLHLRDLVYHQTEVYALIEIKNKSQIDFEMDYLKIFKVNGNKRRKSSYQKIPLAPIYKHNFPMVVKDGKSKSFVVVLPKFTLGGSEKFLLELKEHRGNRILQLIYD